MRHEIMSIDTKRRLCLFGGMNSNITWQIVDSIAAELGAKPAARFKWRQSGRGVPALWRIKIVQELMRRGVPVSLDDLAGLPVKPGRIAA